MLGRNGLCGGDFILDYHLGITLSLIRILNWIFIYSQTILIGHLLLLYSLLIFLTLLSFVLIYFAIEMSSSPLFTYIVIDIDSFLYKIRDSSLILRIPDEPPCYVRYYGGNARSVLAISFGMLCLLFINALHVLYYYSGLISVWGLFTSPLLYLFISFLTYSIVIIYL